MTHIDRGAVFPVVMTFIGIAIFVGFYIAIHAVWPTIQATALDNSPRGYFTDLVGYVNLWILILPAIFLVVVWLYFNIRVSRDSNAGPGGF